ncbi:MAG: hypothetical protein LC122_09005 [Chitinophagales bacterium]|nr:hypothetical protein [Chitinophagales bacterium]
MKTANIVFIVLLLIITKEVQSQRALNSEIFGSSPIESNGIGPSLIDPNWGALPSSQYDIISNNNDGQNIDNSENIEGEVSADADDEPPPPPDDPQDIPLDGGTSILLLLAAGLEYKRRVKSKK